MEAGCPATSLLRALTFRLPVSSSALLDARQGGGSFAEARVSWAFSFRPKSGCIEPQHTLRLIKEPARGYRHCFAMASRRLTNLAARVRFLSDPHSYPVAPHRVEAHETHMSWVFLTDDRAYKLKKPVRRPFLDFSTVAKRRFFCEEGLRLNRRLAPETYLGTIPVCRLPSGTFSLGDGGRIVDWVVEMRRLPQADMLDERIARNTVHRRQIDTVAARLAEFYSRCAPERDQ